MDINSEIKRWKTELENNEFYQKQLVDSWSKVTDPYERAEGAPLHNFMISQYIKSKDKIKLKIKELQENKKKKLY